MIHVSKILQVRLLCQHKLLRRSTRPHLYLFFLSFLFFTAPLSYGLDTNTALGEYVFQSWTLRDGLPNEEVITVGQTPEGYLWIGTQQGLARFDGLRFSNFTPKTLPQLPHESIRTLTTDSRGRLWVGTLNGLAVLDKGQWKNMSHLLRNKNVFVVVSDPNQCMWFGTNGGLTQYCSDSSYRTFTTADGLVSDQIRSIAFDENGNMYVGTLTGLFQYRDQKFFPYPANNYFKDVRVSAMLLNDGDFYIGTGDRGLFRIQSGKLAQLAKAKIGTRPITSLFKDANSSIWIGTPTGLFRFASEAISEFPKDHALSESFVRIIFEDRDKSLWIGCHQSGLNRIRDGALRTLTKEGNGLAGDVVYTVFEDRDQNVWVGTDSGVSVLDAALKVLRNVPVPAVISIAQGVENQMWFGTYRDGLIEYRNGLMKGYGVEAGVPSIQIRSLLPLEDGTVWIGSGEGLAVLTKRGIEVQKNFPRVPVVSMLLDPRKRIWIATLDEGLFVYESGSFKRLGKKEGLSSHLLSALSQISEEHILIGTNGDGLFISDGSLIRRIPPESGFIEHSLATIVPDLHGRVWFAGNGIFHVDKQVLLDVFKNQKGVLTPIVYGTDDGMKHRETSGGNQPVSCRTKSGHLLFASMKGLVVADPSKIKKTPEGPGSLLVEKIVIDGVELPLRDTLVAPAGTKRIEIQYSTLTFISPETVSFKNKLEPFEQNWMEAETKRNVTYTNLSPGDYSFSLMAMQNGISSHQPLVFKLKILPYFYQRKLFYVLVGLVLIGTIVVIHWLRMRRMVAQNRRLEQIITSRTEALQEAIKTGATLEERNRIAQELHDTVAQGLSALTVQLRLALRLNTSNDGEAILQNALALAKQSLQETRSAILSIRPSSLSHGGIQGALQELARYYSGSSGLQLSLSINGESFPLTDEIELNLLRICQEAMNNAVKHSRAKNLSVSLNYGPGSVEVRVEDDGCGLNDKPASKESLGLIGMQERAQRIGAKLTIDSRNGRGTTVTCQLPFSHDRSAIGLR